MIISCCPVPFLFYISYLFGLTFTSLFFEKFKILVLTRLSLCMSSACPHLVSTLSVCGLLCFKGKKCSDEIVFGGFFLATFNEF